MKYPEQILKGRKAIEGSLLGCLIKDIALIKEYNLNEDMFISTEGKFYFNILNTLLKQGVVEVTDTDIRLNCQDDVIAKYKDLGGIKTVNKLKDSVDSKNFEVYLDELYKRNIYMDLINKEGIDLLEERLIGESTISYLDFFTQNNMSAEEIIKFMSFRMMSKLPKNIDRSVQECDGDITEEDLEDLFSGKSMGVLFDTVEDIPLMPHISKEILGLKKKTLSMLGAFVNVGKTTLLCNIILSLASKKQMILAITNEMQLKDFKISFLLYILNNFTDCKTVNKRKLKSGQLTDAEKDKIREARLYYNEHFSKYIKLAAIDTTDIRLVEKLVRKYTITDDIDVLIYDTFKQNFSESGEATYKDLIRDSETIFTLCKSYNLIGLCAIQLAQQYMGNLVLDLSMLSGAKGINQILENLIMMRTIYKEEMDEESKYYIRPYKRVKTPNGWKEEEIELNPNNAYRCVFISKCRDANTFEDSNEASILSFNGYSGTVKEIGLCHPKRGYINQNYSKK